MQAKAISRFGRHSYRKVGQILKIIRGKRVSKAFDLLMFVKKGSVSFIEKTLKSAVANCGMLKNPESLFVREAFSTMGPPIKRMRPGAMGRGNLYKRKTCHLTIVVADRKGN
ncbi:MAG: 50S ribosomal protein L22 [Elusimicrobia bacterium]|nr:50S ribosomal protein L22 [Elusimicrobiota bacterium]